MSMIDIAVSWAVGIANDNSHGYDQSSRWGPDYDCSSLIIQAWENAGVPVKSKGASYTGNMVSVFKKCGFKDVTSSITLSTGAGLQKGDVVWRSGHVEMVSSNGYLVGAHINEKGTITGGAKGDQTGNEINVRTYYNKPWTTVLRYIETVDENTTYSKNAYLSQAEMQSNARYIYQYFSSLGWTRNAIAGMLGNMQVESTINAGIWQNLDSGNTNLGYGLVQWTPATKILNWLSNNGYANDSLKGQCARIEWERQNGEQYYATDSYPESFTEFTKSTKSPEYLASAFLKNYERAGVEKESVRQENARYWYDYLENYEPSAPDPDEPSTNHRKKSMSLLLMYMATRK